MLWTFIEENMLIWVTYLTFGPILLLDIYELWVYIKTWNFTRVAILYIWEKKQVKECFWSKMLNMSKNEGSLTSVSYFITTTYDMVDDLSLDSIISWSQSGKSFIIWNPEEFYNNLLQRFCFQRINTFFSFLFSHVSYLYMITLVRCHHR